MSIKIMAEVWEHASVSQGTLLVLLALADSADERSRECWPAVSSLAKKARLSERQVQRCIMELVEAQMVVVFQNAGRAGSNLFRITVVTEWRGDKMSGGDAHVTGGVTPMSPGGVTPMSPKPSYRTINEPSDIVDDGLFSAEDLPEEATTKESKEVRTEEQFERFWKAYPASVRKTDKPKARTLFAQIVAGRRSGIPKTDPEEIIDGARRYAGTSPDPQYVPLPATWLNGARWEVEQVAPAVEPPRHYGGHRRSEAWGEVVR